MHSPWMRQTPNIQMWAIELIYLVLDICEK